MQSASVIGPDGNAKQPLKTRDKLRQRRGIDRAREQRDGHAGGTSALGDDERRLAQQRLPVGAAFARERPRRAFERGIEADQVGHDFGARAERSADELQREAQSARRARARRLRGTFLPTARSASAA